MQRTVSFIKNIYLCGAFIIYYYNIFTIYDNNVFIYSFLELNNFVC